jgi:hypothetical protein
VMADACCRDLKLVAGLFKDDDDRILDDRRNGRQQRFIVGFFVLIDICNVPSNSRYFL